MNKQIFTGIILALSFLFLISSVSAVAVSSCGASLDSAGTYILTGDLTIIGEASVCINITNGGVILDMNGSSITGDDSADQIGVWVTMATDSGDVTIKNGTLGNMASGIKTEDMSVGTLGTLSINDITINDPFTGNGIIFEFGSNLEINNFILDCSTGAGCTGEGIGITIGLGNFSNLRIIDIDAGALRCAGAGTICTVNNIFVNGTNSIEQGSIKVTDEAIMNITNGYIETRGAVGYASGVDTDGVLYLENVTYAGLQGEWSNVALGSISRNWYVNVAVNWTNGSIANGINVSTYSNGVNGTGLLSSSLTSGGLISRQIIQSYLNDFANGYLNKTPHSVNISYLTSTNSTSFTLDGNKNIFLTISSDSTPPTINITYPINATTYSSSVSELKYTSSESGNCWYSRNAGVTNSSTVTSGTNFTNVTSVTGSNTWTLYCEDDAGNQASTSITFTLINPTELGGGSSVRDKPETSYDERIVCSETMKFIYNHMNILNETLYTIEDLEDFRTDLIIKLGWPISKSDLEVFINNFETMCGPFNASIILDELPASCIVDDKDTFAFPFFNFERDYNCNQVAFWRFFYRVEYAGKGKYEVTGLKPSLPAILIILLLIIFVIKFSVKGMKNKT